MSTIKNTFNPDWMNTPKKRAKLAFDIIEELYDAPMPKTHKKIVLKILESIDDKIYWGANIKKKK